MDNKDNSLKTLDFYFDFLSPYAYFTWLKIRKLCDQYSITLNCRPVVLAALFKHWGHQGPVSIPSKLLFVFRHVSRLAKINQIPFKVPSKHPFNSLPGLRLALKEVSGAKQIQVIDGLYKAVWAKGLDISDEKILQEVFLKLDLDPQVFLAKIQKDSIKALLKKETEDAAKLNIFGVPTFLYDDELLWGNDQVEILELLFQGKDPLCIHDDISSRRFLGKK